MESAQDPIDLFAKHIDTPTFENPPEIHTSDEISSDPTSETFQSIVQVVIEEERRLIIEEERNSVLIPKTKRKISCIFTVHQESIDFLSKDSQNNSMSFKKYVANKREEKGTMAVLKQCGQFFSYVRRHEKTQDMNGMKPDELILAVCEQTPAVFNNYFNILRDQSLKPSTILIHINSLTHLIDWLRMTANSHFSNLTEVRKRLDLERRLSSAIATRANKLKTIERLIATKEWIEDGILGAQRMMRDCWPYFDALIRLSYHQRLSCHQFSWCVGYTLASLWVFAVNARSESIERMTLKSWKEITINQFSLSNKFKTSSTYQYQIIASTDILKLYVNNLRKSAIPPEIDSDESALFPTYGGTPLASGEASRKVEKIFRIYGYHINITTLRDMISTHVEDMFQAGELTKEEYHNLVIIGQTHSHATHHQFYDRSASCRKRKYAEGRDIQESYQRITQISHTPDNSIVPTDSTQQPSRSSSEMEQSNNFQLLQAANYRISTNPSPEQLQAMDEMDWGLARKDLDKEGKRFEWLPEELDYFEDYIKNIEADSNQKNRFAICLGHLKTNASIEIKRYFHPHHITNSDRFKNGFIAALKRLEKS